MFLNTFHSVCMQIILAIMSSLNPISPLCLHCYKCQFISAHALLSVVSPSVVFTQKTPLLSVSAWCVKHCSHDGWREKRLGFHTETLTLHHLCGSRNMLSSVKVGRTQFSFSTTDLVFAVCATLYHTGEITLTVLYIDIIRTLKNMLQVNEVYACCRCNYTCLSYSLWAKNG